MALLPIDDLLGPTYSTLLRPRRLPGRFRPTKPRVDVPALHHYAAAVSIQVDTDFFISRYDLLQVAALLQPCWGLGHAIIAPCAELQQSTHISCYTSHVYKSFKS
jgi:hypothetical protein